MDDAAFGRVRISGAGGINALLMPRFSAAGCQLRRIRQHAGSFMRPGCALCPCRDTGPVGPGSGVLGGSKDSHRFHWTSGESSTCRLAPPVEILCLFAGEVNDGWIAAPRGCWFRHREVRTHDCTIMRGSICGQDANITGTVAMVARRTRGRSGSGARVTGEVVARTDRCHRIAIAVECRDQSLNIGRMKNESQSLDTASDFRARIRIAFGKTCVTVGIWSVRCRETGGRRIPTFTRASQTGYTSYTFAAGTLSDVSGFMRHFFGISPREAEQMDPQQRLLLERLGRRVRGVFVHPACRGSRGAVYLGFSGSDYSYRRADDLASLDDDDRQYRQYCAFFNRISYQFDLRGPAWRSTPHVPRRWWRSIRHQSIRHGRIAIRRGVGGVSLHLQPICLCWICQADAVAARGICKRL